MENIQHLRTLFLDLFAHRPLTSIKTVIIPTENSKRFYLKEVNFIFLILGSDQLFLYEK